MKSFFKLSMLVVVFAANSIVAVDLNDKDPQGAPTREELQKAVDKTSLGTSLTIGLWTGVFSGITGGLGHYVAMTSGATPGVALGVSALTFAGGAVAMREARKEAITKLLGEEYAASAVVAAMLSGVVIGGGYFAFIGKNLIKDYNAAAKAADERSGRLYRTQIE